MKARLQLLLFIISAAIPLVSVAQHDSTAAWFNSLGGESMDQSNAVFSDNEGSIYLTGGFQSVSSFGKRTLEASGDTDIFIAKYTKEGKLEWITRAGSDAILNYSLSEAGTDIVVYENAVYVTGRFLGTAKFGDVQLTSFGNADIFLAKFSLHGNLEWVKQAGGENQDASDAMTVDKNGNIYITGSFQNKASFDGTFVTATNSTDMFLAKYKPDGELQWVRSSHDEGSTEGKAIQCQNNYCITGGNFERLVEFGDTQLTGEDHAVFLNKYSQEGDLLWAKKFGDDDIDLEDVQIRKNSIYLTGSFKNKILSGENEYTSMGGTDAYVAMLNIKGEVQWIQTMGGPGNDYGKNLGFTADKQLLVGGTFNSYMRANNHIFPGKGNDDIFIASLDHHGLRNWSETFGGAGQDQLKGMLSSGNSIFIAGHFLGSFDFKGDNHISKGSSDGFLAKIQVKDGHIKSTHSEENSLAFYPNPSKDFIILEYRETMSEVKIHDITGKLVFEKELNNSLREEISLKGIPSGIYLIKVQAKKGILAGKLVIEK